MNCHLLISQVRYVCYVKFNSNVLVCHQIWPFIICWPYACFTYESFNVALNLFRVSSKICDLWFVICLMSSVLSKNTRTLFQDSSRPAVLPSKSLNPPFDQQVECSDHTCAGAFNKSAWLATSAPDCGLLLTELQITGQFEKMDKKSYVCSLYFNNSFSAVVKPLLLLHQKANQPLALHGGAASIFSMM